MALIGPPTDGKDKVYSLNSAGRMPKREITFSDKLRHLSALKERYHFFVPGALYLCGRFNELILQDFMESQRKDVDIGFYRFRHPIVSGLTTPKSPAWNHVLWSVENDVWPAFLDHLCAAVLVDHTHQMVFRYGYQEFEAIDPLYIERTVVLPARPPSVMLGAFGVMTNTYTAGFDLPAPGQLPGDVLDRYTLKFEPPLERSVLYAKALFSNADPQLLLHYQDIADKQKEFNESRTDVSAPDRRGAGEGR
jgi:hypothetical protein